MPFSLLGSVLIFWWTRTERTNSWRIGLTLTTSDGFYCTNLLVSCPRVTTKNVRLCLTGFRIIIYGITSTSSPLGVQTNSLLRCEGLCHLIVVNQQLGLHYVTCTAMSNSQMNRFKHGIQEENSNKLIYDNFDCSQNESKRQNL